ncbi:uncharacterized protein B0H64DRAFT_225587 [Chaetomium fimeti]|uniref:Uncharacterized protein n=1 Tax=Chaetomium fimeti TaxID=1854472 RepID=A0AAE0LPB0_9PEZI|nr:hypothetical protein B0H64DRAFT_225587 [Chaetomium fimeti]
MQLSAFLSATALFAQAASGFYLNSPNAPGDARVSGGRSNGVGFLSPELSGGPLADIKIDTDKDIGKSGYMFQYQGLGSPLYRTSSYRLVSTERLSIGSDDITRPFAIEDGNFVYKGEGEHNTWHLYYGGYDRWDIYLATASLEGVIYDQHPHHRLNVTLSTRPSSNDTLGR